MLPRFKLVYQFALMAGVAFLVIAGMAVVALYDREAVHGIFNEHRELLDVKNRITQLELETLRTRLDESQVVDLRNRAILIHIFHRSILSHAN